MSKVFASIPHCSRQSRRPMLTRLGIWEPDRAQVISKFHLLGWLEVVGAYYQSLSRRPLQKQQSMFVRQKQRKLGRRAWHRGIRGWIRTPQLRGSIRCLRCNGRSLGAKSWHFQHRHTQSQLQIKKIYSLSQLCPWATRDNKKNSPGAPSSGIMPIIKGGPPTFTKISVARGWIWGASMPQGWKGLFKQVIMGCIKYKNLRRWNP